MKSANRWIAALLAAFLALQPMTPGIYAAELPDEPVILTTSEPNTDPNPLTVVDPDQPENLEEPGNLESAPTESVPTESVPAESVPTESTPAESALEEIPDEDLDEPEEALPAMEESDRLHAVLLEDHLTLTFRDFSDNDCYTAALFELLPNNTLRAVNTYTLDHLAPSEDLCEVALSLDDGTPLLEANKNYQLQLTAGETTLAKNFTKRAGVQALKGSFTEEGLALAWELPAEASLKAIEAAVYSMDDLFTPIKETTLEATSVEVTLPIQPEQALYRVVLTPCYEVHPEATILIDEPPAPMIFLGESATVQAEHLQMPEHLTAKAGDAKVILTFDEVPNATAYRVYRNGELLTTVAVDQLTANDGVITYEEKTAKNGTAYTYAIEAIAAVANEEVVSQRTEETKAVTPKIVTPAKPTGVKLTMSNLALRLEWTKVEGADYYIVERYNTKTKKYVVLNNKVTATSYNNTKLTKDTKYTYRVCAVRNDGKTTAKSTYSSTVSAYARIMPGKVTNLKAVAKDASVQLSWSKVTNASGYRIYRYNETNKTYTVLGDTTSLNYTVTGLTNGESASFAVAAYRKINSTKYPTNQKSNLIKATPKILSVTTMKTFTAVNADEAVKLSWSAATNATHYELYRKAEGEEDFGLIKTLSASFSAGGTKGKLKSATNLRSGPGTSYKIVKVLPKNTTLNIYGTSGSYYKVDNGYVSIQYTTIVSNSQAVSQMSYLDENLTNGVLYTYQVRGIRKSGGQTSASSFLSTTIKPSMTKAAAPTSLTITAKTNENVLTWNAGRKADYYRVYLMNNQTNQYDTLLADNVTGCSFTHNLSNTQETFFKYKVTSMRIIDGVAMESDNSVTKSAYAKNLLDKVSQVRTIHYNVSVTSKSNTYASASGAKVGTVSYGTKGVELRRANSRSEVKLSNGKKVWIPTSRLYRSKSLYNAGTVYSSAVAEAWVNHNKFSSNTQYLCWISQYSMYVYVFKGSAGNWKQIRRFRCGIGKTSTPTPMSLNFSVWGKDRGWYRTGYYEVWCTKFFSRNAFHSRIHRYGGGFSDSRIGAPISNGCVRMYDADCKWIYDNIPNSTRVISY